MKRCGWTESADKSWGRKQKTGNSAGIQSWPQVPKGTKRIEWVTSQITFLQITSSISIASVSLVQRITNFVHCKLLEKSIFQNLRKPALITYFVKISMSAAYFASLSLVRYIRNLGHYKTRKNSSFQNICEAAQTTCFIVTWMSVAHYASVNPVRRITSFVH